MGWNTSFLLAEKKTLADMKSALRDFKLTSTRVNWETASSLALGNDLALGEMDGWGVVWDPNARATMLGEYLKAASKGGRALGVVLNSADTYYEFCLYAKGKQKRTVLRRNFKVIEEEGTTLPEEANLDWNDQERALFQLTEKITGLDLSDFDRWHASEFTVAVLDL